MIFYFYHIVYMNLLIVFKKIFFCLKDGQKSKQEINETNESQIGMDSLIPNGNVFEMYFVTLS